MPTSAPAGSALPAVMPEKLPVVAVALSPEQCRAARGLLDWTQVTLAMRAGVSRSTVRDYEKGRHALHVENAGRIVQALKAAGAELLPGGVRLLRATEGGFPNPAEAAEPTQSAPEAKDAAGA